MADLKISSTGYFAQYTLSAKRQVEPKVNTQNQTVLKEKSVSGDVAAAALGINFKGNSNPKDNKYFSEKVKKRPDGTIESIEKHDSNGLVETLFFQADGNTLDFKAAYKNGQITKITQYRDDGISLEFVDKCIDEKIIEKLLYQDDGKTIKSVLKYKYQDGQLDKVLFYQADGKTLEIVVQCKNGKIAEAVEYSDDGKTRRLLHKYTDGQLSEIIEYRDDGKTPKKLEHFTNGKLVELQLYRPDGTRIYAERYKDGKPTTRTWYEIDGEAILKFERVLSAYPKMLQ